MNNKPRRKSTRGCKPRRSRFRNMPRSVTLVIAAGLLAAACSTINPQIGQLETFKQQAAARNWQAIADAKVACASEAQGCVQLY
jgi:hypothetical protein